MGWRTGSFDEAATSAHGMEGIEGSLPSSLPGLSQDPAPRPSKQDIVAWLKEGSGNCKGKTNVLFSTVRQFPGTLVLPVCLLLLLVGVGVYGVLAGQSLMVADKRAEAQQLADVTMSAFKLTVQQMFLPVVSVATYLERQPNWPTFQKQFYPMAAELINITETTKGAQLQIAPNGVVSAVYPNLMNNQGEDMTDCCLNDVLREVSAGGLLLDGPYALTPARDGATPQWTLVLSLPVFVATNAPGSAPDPAWAVPASVGNCSSTACYNPDTNQRWYGTVYMLMLVSKLVQDPNTKLPDLKAGGWWFTLSRTTPTSDGDQTRRQLLVYWGSDVTNPVSSKIQITDTEFELLLCPSEGWQPPWWPAVMTGVVLVSLLVCSLLFMTLLSKKQNAWLLYSILPRQVVQALRQGHSWSHKSDCCVLFADVVGFTRITATMRPETIATMVGQLFHVFEELTEQHGMTKVDIIGDCYMAVAGMLEDESPESCAVKAVRLALDMVSCTDGLTTRSGEPVQVRVGIHAGPVVAVLVGVKSPKLTVFGDVVNTCSRLQTTSLPACVQVSATVAERLIAAGPAASGLVLSERGQVKLRNRGVATTWWVRLPGHPEPPTTADEQAAGSSPMQTACRVSCNSTAEDDSTCSLAAQRKVFSASSAPMLATRSRHGGTEPAEKEKYSRFRSPSIPAPSSFDSTNDHVRVGMSAALSGAVQRCGSGLPQLPGPGRQGTEDASIPGTGPAGCSMPGGDTMPLSFSCPQQDFGPSKHAGSNGEVCDHSAGMAGAVEGTSAEAWVMGIPQGMDGQAYSGYIPAGPTARGSPSRMSSISRHQAGSRLASTPEQHPVGDGPMVLVQCGPALQDRTAVSSPGVKRMAGYQLDTASASNSAQLDKHACNRGRVQRTASLNCGFFDRPRQQPAYEPLRLAPSGLVLDVAAPQTSADDAGTETSNSPALTPSRLGQEPTSGLSLLGTVARALGLRGSPRSPRGLSAFKHGAARSPMSDPNLQRLARPASVRKRRASTGDSDLPVRSSRPSPIGIEQFDGSEPNSAHASVSEARQSSYAGVGRHNSLLPSNSGDPSSRPQSAGLLHDDQAGTSKANRAFAWMFRDRVSMERGSDQAAPGRCSPSGHSMISKRRQAAPSHPLHQQIWPPISRVRSYTDGHRDGTMVASQNEACQLGNTLSAGVEDAWQVPAIATHRPPSRQRASASVIDYMGPSNLSDRGSTPSPRASTSYLQSAGMGARPSRQGAPGKKHSHVPFWGQSMAVAGGESVLQYTSGLPSAFMRTSHGPDVKAPSSVDSREDAGR